MRITKSKSLKAIQLILVSCLMTACIDNSVIGQGEFEVQAAEKPSVEGFWSFLFENNMYLRSCYDLIDRAENYEVALTLKTDSNKPLDVMLFESPMPIDNVNMRQIRKLHDDSKINLVRRNGMLAGSIVTEVRPGYNVCFYFLNTNVGESVKGTYKVTAN